MSKKSSISNNQLTMQNSSISNNSVSHKYTVLMPKKVLFQTIQFSRTTLFQCKKKKQSHLKQFGLAWVHSFYFKKSSLV